METDDMLRAIYKLSEKDGLSYSELSDITNWYERSNQGEFDTSRLQEKSRERIIVIFHRFYKVS